MAEGLTVSDNFKAGWNALQCSFDSANILKSNR